tara:strand:+ start:166 stop:369 length:204 start_codon:yes stop_codon:yes gene_type:complete
MNKPYQIVYEYRKNEAWAHRPAKWVVVRDEGTVWASDRSVAKSIALNGRFGVGVNVISVDIVEGWQE